MFGAADSYSCPAVIGASATDLFFPLPISTSSLTSPDVDPTTTRKATLTLAI